MTENYSMKRRVFLYCLPMFLFYNKQGQQPEGRSNLKGGRVLKSRAPILGQNSFQQDHTVAQG